jgi:hypothetical protein
MFAITSRRETGFQRAIQDILLFAQSVEKQAASAYLSEFPASVAGALGQPQQYRRFRR